ncbi:SPW repeat protein [Streptomyces lunaelactis]|uniref:SPW repeat protein n=1 Tax=Streptomyces lunaelactis TaxID=1535768 RepID=UPI0015854E93|nr:SPW repeat protein [Streptomyces lunaelactis]NUK00102.1 SPW repeat protein [Streptomyces lunaelactis]NUK06916.1 SPW repeat protein [Streptomyces lunaelactis]NUK15438.1 SPW repeat protein [Streptomyces lunaelactis]NUK22382.1 SPW repeat protein [Streptomyces lunaelactis]NUK33168.1 SPW repeat protein [Streptomyces lunaelactis]
MTTHPRIEEHPDLAEMRSRFERATTTPRAQAIETLALLTGLYLAASPWIVGFNGLTTLAVCNLITGAAYVLCMGGFGSAYERTHAMAWCAIAIGAWTIVAPWVVAGNVDTTRSIVSNVIVGAVALLLGLAMAAMDDRMTGRMTGRARAGAAPNLDPMR